MVATADVINAIRHVVQDHGDEGTQLGTPADPAGMHWFGRLLGWDWPTSYIELMSRHDGLTVLDAMLLGFTDSIGLLMQFRETWHQQSFWPIAADGCGNYFALALGERDDAGECPVVFLDAAADAQDRPTVVATSYARFVAGQMRQQCERAGCDILAEPDAAATGGA